MSMRPGSWPEPAAEISAAVRVMYGSRRRPLPVVVRDELGEVFADAAFVEAFAASGPAGWSPGRLALVTVLQMAENLGDRQAAEAVRDKISWKYALGLSLADPGFDFSVLSQFRDRIIAHGLETKVLDLLLEALIGRGLLKPGGKQRTDSTHVLAAVRELNRVELAGETVRAALEAIAAADPGWLTSVIDVSDWQQRYGQRVDGWRMPASKPKRDQIGNAYGRDARALLEAVYAPGAPPWLARLPAVDVLRMVLLQNFVIVTDRQGREVVRMREADTDGLPPGRSKITSPYDLDARRGRKRDLAWNGYKLHISETCDATPAGPAGMPPNLITNVATTDASVTDNAMTTPIHQDLQRRGLLPAQHYLDSGYPSAALLVSARTDHGITLITPLLADTSPQAKAGTGYDRTAFTIDHDQRQATCPQGHPSSSWTPAVQRGNDVIVIRFPTATCRPCPVKSLCTTAARGRQITTRPQPVQQALDDARTLQTTPQWQTTYNLRAGVEATIAQSVKVTDTRQARYRGLPKTHLEHTFKAAALNLIRLCAWWNGHHLTPQHTSHLARLQHTP